MLLTNEPQLQPLFGFPFDKTKCEVILNILNLLRYKTKVWQTAGTYTVKFSTLQLFTQCFDSRSKLSICGFFFLTCWTLNRIFEGKKVFSPEI